MTGRKLFKGDWAQIHEFVTNTGNLGETPIAYLRAGDPESLETAFKSAGCEVQQHPFGYRSIHYQIKSQPAKCVRVAELQVRTIFEEGWSEIDHRVRYPRHSADPYLGALLDIFNRLAGGADEMGTFTKQLSTYLTEQTLKEAERQRLLSDKEEQLKDAVSQLEISQSQKKALQAQITELRQSSKSSSVGDLLSGYGLAPISAVNLQRVSNIFQKTCERCGKNFVDLSSYGLSGLHTCPDCLKQISPHTW